MSSMHVCRKCKTIAVSRGSEKASAGPEHTSEKSLVNKYFVHLLYFGSFALRYSLHLHLAPPSAVNRRILVPTQSCTPHITSQQPIMVQRFCIQSYHSIINHAYEVLTSSPELSCENKSKHHRKPLRLQCQI